jgi:hypothetical protein
MNIKKSQKSIYEKQNKKNIFQSQYTLGFDLMAMGKAALAASTTAGRGVGLLLWSDTTTTELQKLLLPATEETATDSDNRLKVKS